MNYTQNEKIEQVTDSTMVVRVDIGSQTNYARAFDNRGHELTKRVFTFDSDIEGFNSFNLWVETLNLMLQAVWQCWRAPIAEGSDGTWSKWNPKDLAREKDARPWSYRR